MQITKDEMYPKNSSVVDKLLIDMATMPIVQVGMYRATIYYLKKKIEPPLKLIE